MSNNLPVVEKEGEPESRLHVVGCRSMHVEKERIVVRTGLVSVERKDGRVLSAKEDPLKSFVWDFQMRKGASGSLTPNTEREVVKTKDTNPK